MRIWVNLGLVVALTGCLQTREIMEDGGEGRATLREQMQALQTKTAQQEIRIDEILAEVRALNGKVGNFSSAAPQESSTQEVEQLKERLKVYEEALEKLDQEIRSLKKSRSSSAAPVKAPAGDLAAGDYHFEQKNWSESIRAYENYRQKNPKGKNYPKATLRIALAFQSMGMNSEAKAFFQEVASQFPKSDEARVASSRLSNL